MPKFETGFDVETPGLLADPIRAYLEQHEKRVDDAVLTETVKRMRQVLVRDLMTPRDTRAGKESNTLYTGACARKSRLTFDGAERDPLRARTLLKFLLGDLVELSVLAIARLAGCHIEDNNIDLSIKGEDGVSVPVHPDGRYVAGDEKHYNVEIKSCDSRTFDSWIEKGGPDDTWGYLTQASIEIQAWREAGVPVMNTIFVAVSTGSRQGSIAEFIMPYKEQLVISWHERRLAARQDAVPEIPFEGQPEMAFMRGKACNADWFAHGEPMPRLNENGATYGWDVMTGRTVVPLACSYCDFKAKHCWQDAVLEMDGTKPVWVVPEKGTVQGDGAGQASTPGCDQKPSDASAPKDEDVFMAASLMLDYQTIIAEALTPEDINMCWDAARESPVLDKAQKAELYKAVQARLKKVANVGK